MLPKPPRQRSDLVVGREPGGGNAMMRRQVVALPAAGTRLVALLGCQDRFLAELRVVLGELRSAAATAAGSSSLATANQVIDWCEAVQSDLMLEATRAAVGHQAVDLLDLCHDVQHDLGLGRAEPPVQVHGHARQTVWGSVPALERLLRLGLQLVAQHTGQQGGLFLEVGDGPRGPQIRIRAAAASAGPLDPEDVACFCELAEEAGVDVHPDDEGGAVAGMLLVVPAALRGPLADRISSGD